MPRVGFAMVNTICMVSSQLYFASSLFLYCKKRKRTRGEQHSSMLLDDLLVVLPVNVSHQGYQPYPTGLQKEYPRFERALVFPSFRVEAGVDACRRGHREKWKRRDRRGRSNVGGTRLSLVQQMPDVTTARLHSSKDPNAVREMTPDSRSSSRACRPVLVLNAIKTDISK